MNRNYQQLATIEEIKLVKKNFVLQIQLIGKINLRKQIQANIFGNWIIKLKGRRKTIGPLLDSEGKLVTEDKEKAELMNTYFTPIG